MEKKNLDWKHIGFAYHTTDYRYVADYKDGKWQEGYLSDSPTVVLNEFFFSIDNASIRVKSRSNIYVARS